MSIKNSILKTGSWIQVRDFNSEFVIEDFQYSSGVDSRITDPHCEKCVVVNKCWFKNENEKKPKNFLFANNIIIDTLLELMPGLYHYMCHCNELPIPSPEASQIELIIPAGKIDWIKTDKGNWINEMGYFDINEFVETLKVLTKEAYCKGNYKIIDHSKFGVKINLNVDIPGKGEKSGRIYRIKTCYMIFPEGRLKCNTLIGGWYK